MDREFTPCKEALIIRMSWIVWPILLIILLERLEILEQPHNIVDSALAAYVFYNISFSVWLHGQKVKFLKHSDLVFRISACGTHMEFQRPLLVITDLFGRERVYARRMINNPLIETRKRWVFPSRQIFSFNYGEGRRVEYWLSELSEADRKQVIILLKAALSDLEED